MNISYKWLKEYVSLHVSAQELADKMSITGIEIEGVTSYSQGLKKLVVGKTLKVIEHPDSDHLHVCQVSVGEHAETGVLQIVCGAPNVAEGQKVIVALPGARIKDNIKIKKGKIRGQESHGMLCSLEELGISNQIVPKNSADGIFVLPADAPVGADIITYLGLDDAILELSITPNRADALSMYGTAYEVGAIYNQKPVFPIVSTLNQTTNTMFPINIQVADTKDCPAYYMTVIKDVTIKDSPLWLQMRLMQMGIRPINNVVDVTNYMMLLYGQPLHAFDYQTLPDKQIMIRRAKSEETLVTLDNESRQLQAEDIIVTAGNEPIALAGVMGGLATEITDKTTTVALEVALFNAENIRMTAKRLNLRSQASMRFEKGINKALLQQVLAHASAMIVEEAGGEIVTVPQGVDTLKIEPKNIEITLAKINRTLGTHLSQAEVVQIFKQLGFDVESIEDSFRVSVPPRRWDIHIEADLIEEVARIYGYDNLPSTLPTTPAIRGGVSPMRQFTRTTGRLLESFGYTQTIGYSLTSPQKAGLFALQEQRSTVLALPMSEERSVLRRSLLTGLLDIAAYNVARSTNDLALYEMGRVFYAKDKNQQPDEVEHVALLLSGNRQDKTWYGKAEKVDFYTIKGTLERYFELIGLPDAISYRRVQKDNMHPGRTAEILLHGQSIGYVGQLHPTCAKRYDLPETYVAELELLPLQQAQRQPLVQTIVPKYPSMTRDIALLVAENVEHQQIYTILQQEAGRYLQTIQLFDHYSGIGIEPGKKSLAYRLTFQNLEATLVEAEVNQAMEQVEAALCRELEATIR